MPNINARWTKCGDVGSETKVNLLKLISQYILYPSLGHRMKLWFARKHRESRVKSNVIGTLFLVMEFSSIHQPPMSIIACAWCWSASLPWTAHWSRWGPSLASGEMTRVATWHSSWLMIGVSIWRSQETIQIWKSSLLNLNICSNIWKK